MRWTLIRALGATGVLLTPFWFFAHITLGPNWVYFAVALSFAALISRNTTSRRFLHGFIVGLMFFAVFGATTILLWTGSFAWAQLRQGGMVNQLSDGMNSAVQLLLWLLIAGLMSGLLLGTLTTVWSQLDPRRPGHTVT